MTIRVCLWIYLQSKVAADLLHTACPQENVTVCDLYLLGCELLSVCECVYTLCALSSHRGQCICMFMCVSEVGGMTTGLYHGTNPFI